mmetsp:Transcript_9257/g.15564  ORF Transcript_9257/g.15564 Transcript_9257/m.15564 type:complete len:85 (-) Transcript_9257:138-392(-)
MKLVDQLFISSQIQSFSMHQIAGILWLAHNMGYMERTMMTRAEERMIKLMNEEIKIQKQIENDYDLDVPEGLQTMNLDDIKFIA